ncbi:hypothetical protein D3C78_1861270 [compost metagenome]
MAVENDTDTADIDLRPAAVGIAAALASLARIAVLLGMGVALGVSMAVARIGQRQWRGAQQGETGEDGDQGMWLHIPFLSL